MPADTATDWVLVIGGVPTKFIKYSWGYFMMQKYCNPPKKTLLMITVLLIYFSLCLGEPGHGLPDGELPWGEWSS